ncbi:unnamed protein product [Adineta steineri]|uniref:Uncharacterized protein n=1 Tax=Adineta steineri TaxID=433720 RepID=A0A814MIG4_9BILA|nr:unnamed protein product [Adineta steineri]CAF1143909.1 unnamed protein product [Adineta steineri]CAF3794499.1 unnamed protein product [Adineta steineri]CAF3965418.1 unnamed protein product [Adineta steineri]
MVCPLHLNYLELVVETMPSNAVVLSVLMVMVLSFIDVSLSARIELFEHNNHRGRKVDHSYGDDDHSCHNLPGWANDKTTSVNTHGRCFILFVDANCQGRSSAFAPGQGDHANIGHDGFNDVTSSYKIC